MAAVSPDSALRIHPRVSIRPEPFGALLYHFGTRRLSFLKSPRLLALVEALDAAPDVEAAMTAVGITEAERPAMLAALGSLCESEMLVVSGDRIAA